MLAQAAEQDDRAEQFLRAVREARRESVRRLDAWGGRCRRSRRPVAGASVEDFNGLSSVTRVKHQGTSAEWLASAVSQEGPRMEISDRGGRADVA